MTWHQTEIQLRPRPPGFHLVTDEIVSAIPELRRFRVGILHLFLEHTSASLGLGENADPDVRTDLRTFVDRLAPDGDPDFIHTAEGPDDMPAHAKSALLGVALTIPIRAGRLALGTWQGIYLGEHRHHGGSRSVVATIWGEAD